MSLDDRLNMYFENDERYADLLNGSVFEGKQVVDARDLCAADSKSIKKNRKARYRDNLRRVVFDTNFAIMALENQKQVDYKMPLRCMDCDVREYERQARVIEQKNRKKNKAQEKPSDIVSSSEMKHGKIRGGEYLSGFRKTDRLHPCVTIVLFFGEEWDGSVSLHQMMDFSEMPEEIRDLVQDYKMKLVHIRKLDNPDVYKSDLRQVFEAVRYAEDKEKMKEIMTKDEAYQHMEEDAAELVAELIHIPLPGEEKKGEKVNMCKAIYDMVEEGREEGREDGLITAVRSLMRKLNKTAEAAMELLEIPIEDRERYLKKL